ncbi:hypothetical protein, partial [Sulfitobacter sp.]|uniref:hypothetical protein n=1 Tax=Sulfitobacter sp. TaxID=1903071 RepID=UPI003001D074
RSGWIHLSTLSNFAGPLHFEAVIRSESVLKGLFGDAWPEGLTLEENLTDLHWHHREFTSKRSFAWIIRDASGTYLGCAYLYPSIGKRGAGDAVYWMTDTPDRLAHLATFGALYEDWLKGLLSPSYVLDLTNNGSL